jgi:lipopolysaccharide export system permease protein
MSLLDRYVGRIVAGAFGAGMLFFLFLWIVTDLLTNASRYVERAGRDGLGGFDLVVWLVGLYLNKIPLVLVTITPFVTVIACMFATARLLHANEVVPMLFVGRRTQRVLRPMLLCGAVAGLGMAVGWQWVVPHFGAPLAEAESFLKHGSHTQKSLIDESPDGLLCLHALEYDTQMRIMKGVTMLSEGALVADTVLVKAASATWDPARRDWRLVDGFTCRGGVDLPREWLERTDLTPEVLMKRSREDLEPDVQSYNELVETMALRPNRPELRLALHRHVTYPLASLVLLLLALPLAVHFERGSRVGRLLIAIGLCAAYMIFDLVCQSAGQRGMIHPVVAAWSPTIVFGSLGVVLFGSMKT